MKELLRSLPDGANDFGNGVIGPSLLDIQRANATSSFENLKAQETRTKDNGDLIFVFSESKLGRFFKEVSGRVPKRSILPIGTVLSLVAVACSGGANKNTVENNRELENEDPSGYSLPFPEGETWFLTTGPHGNGFSAIDIAPPELGRLNGNCPTDGSRLSIENRVVTASASGKVMIKGDDRNRNDPDHSVIHIKNKSGLTQVYVHLDKTKVKLGDKVKQGDPLGNPSCEYPPGGRNTGPHVHVGLMKDGKALPIDGTVIGGWTIHENGTMTKPGEKTRTANVGRYGNDLPNNPNKAVVASPKDPIPPIAGKVTEKSISATTERQVEEGWKRFNSNHIPYQIDIPSTWKGQSNEAYDYFDEIESEKDPEYQTSTRLFVYLITRDVGDIETYTTTYANDIKRLGGKVFYSGNIDKSLIRLLNLKIASQKTAYVVFIPADRPNRIYIRAAFMAYGKMVGIQIETASSNLSEKAPLLEKTLSTFTLLPENKIKTKPTETPKPAVEKKVSISKKPEELYRVLLTNPISPDILPQGMSSRGTSASEIDATGKALKQVGAVTIKIEDSTSTVARGIPNGGIVYSIFPDSSGAKNASEVIGTHLKNGQVLKDSPYPTKIYTIENLFGAITRILIASVDNVTVVATFTGTNADLVQSRTVSLGHAAIEHLGKVGK